MYWCALICWTFSCYQQPGDHPECADDSEKQKGCAPPNLHDQQGEQWGKDSRPDRAAKSHHAQAKCAALRCSSLMMGIAASPSTALSAKLMAPRTNSITSMIQPYGEMRVRVWLCLSFCG